MVRNKRKEVWISLLSDREMVKRLPLSTWKRIVRRRYLPGEQQAANLEAWYEKWIKTQGNFVDLSNRSKPKTLIRGGQEGLDNFNKVLRNHMELVHGEYLSGKSF